MRKLALLYTTLYIMTILASCSKDEEPAGPTTPPVPETPPFDIEKLSDTYGSITALSNSSQWGPYNVHDPAMLHDGEYYYCYSTDVGYGMTAPPGIQVRKSKDLVDWKFVGWAFKSLPKQGADFIRNNGGTPFEALWAPYVLKVGSEYRLYYSLSSAKPRLSVIGLATSASPEGPWIEKGLAVTSLDNAAIQTNAIDPTVMVTSSGEHWMYYGSAWDGIYILRLDASTGLAATAGDKGTRLAQRGFTSGTINGNIEGAEIIYHSTLKKYYLFIAYDWLETKYNVRVGRADSPQGPFVDYQGHDLNEEIDHGPMILAPYKFKGHGGWQGTSHVGITENNGQYFLAHQGRPGVDKFFMVLHVRKIFWTENGWPVVSPERYAGTQQTPVTAAELTGAWERIELGYQVVPGYASEQVSPNFQEAVTMTLDAAGTINGNAANTWTYQPPWLELKWSTTHTDNVIVERGRDWENKKPCLVFTGLNDDGKAIWGKK